MIDKRNTDQTIKEPVTSSFAVIVDQNADKIYRLALKMVGNEQDAEDILQETFIKAMQNIDQFQGRSKVSTWLYRIAVNESLMFLRKQNKTVVNSDIELETENGDYSPRQIIDWCCLPEKELMSKEVKKQLQSAIQTLTEANRSAFLLRDIEGLSTRDAADILEISEPALKVRLMRARMQLREELTTYFTNKIPQES